MLGSRDSAEPRLALLGSSTAHALRGECVGLVVWVASVGALALVISIVSKGISSLGISKQLEHTLQKLGAGSALTPKGYIGVSFSFFVLAISLFAISQIAAARHEEADERLETLLALPLSRRGWLGGGLALAETVAGVRSLCAGLFTWLGATSQGVSLSPLAMLEASANCLPVAILFLGIVALAYAALPRTSAAIAYGLLIGAHLWQLFGSLLGVPKWLVQATPFAHVGAVPAVAFQPVGAVVMLTIGLLASLAAIVRFERPDLMGA